MKALVLAAGYGTRLYPLTKDYPKPLLPVRNVPIINYIIKQLEKIEEVDKIIIVCNDRFFEKFKSWKRKYHFEKEIKILNDKTTSNTDRKGAIGDTIFAIDDLNLQEDLLVVGGDNLNSLNLNRFINFARTRNACCIALYDIKDREKATRFGVVKVDRNFRIKQFQEKPSNPASTLIATCIYYFPKESLSLLFAYEAAAAGRHDATGLYINWLSQKIPVYGFRFVGKWFDIGHLDTYKKVQSIKFFK
jgi:glucose-1-phosphate thymidylyltransferase